MNHPEHNDSQPKPIRLLVVDPNKSLASLIMQTFNERTQVERAPTADTALQMLGLSRYDIIVLQLRLPLFSGVELASKVRKIKPELPIISLSPHINKKEVEALHKLGYPPPIAFTSSDDDVLQRCQDYIIAVGWLKTVAEIQSQFKEHYGFDRIISRTASMRQVLERLTRVVSSRVPVLTVGESGTGKELIARMLHSTGERAKKPFITVNCAAVPEGLLESQFFGHEKGAFTGANIRVAGKFELANGGTLFLDEIGEMSPALQAKLLRVLEYGEFERVGGTETIRVDVRLITATHRNLEQMVEDGRFRADLFYRINVFPIKLPPLRQRLEDIPLLTYYFLSRICQRNNRQILAIDPQAIELLKCYPWRGNIRELENAVERALLLSDNSRLKPEDFPQQLEYCEMQMTSAISEKRAGDFSGVVEISDTISPKIENAAVTQPGGQPRPLHIKPDISASECVRLAKTAFSDKLIDESTASDLDDETPIEGADSIRKLADIERETIQQALEITAGNIALAARCLGIGRNTLYRKIEEHGIRRDEVD